MSQDQRVTLGSGGGAAVPLAPEPLRMAPVPSPPPGAPQKQRIFGVDLARGFALLGMFTAHFGLATEAELMSPTTWGGLVNGRSSILFAILAGVSLAIITGKTTPFIGQKLADARFKIIVRALCIFVIGELLTSLTSYIAIILQTYAVLFLVAALLLRVRRRWLVTVALVWALIGPFLAAVWEPLAASLGLGVPLTDLLIWGSYPVLTWIPFIVIGLAIGRTDLTKRANHIFLLVVGAIIAVVGYAAVIPFADHYNPDESTGFGKFNSGSYSEGSGRTENLGTLGNNEAKMGGTYTNPCLDAADYGLCVEEDWAAVSFGDEYSYPNEEGTKDQILNNLAGWKTAVPHSGTPFEILGSGGFAVAFLGLCLLIMPLVRVVFAPIVAMGSMSLTVYVAHVISFRILQNSFESFGELMVTPWILTILGCAVFATVWLKLRGKGPLESLLNRFVQRVTTAHDNRIS